MGAANTQIYWWDPYNARQNYKNAEIQYLGNE